MTQDRTAPFYRMVLPDEVCHFGVLAKDMLQDAGHAIEEHLWRSREQVDTFEAKHRVDTTPQIFIGSSEDLQHYLGA